VSGYRDLQFCGLSAIIVESRQEKSCKKRKTMSASKFVQKIEVFVSSPADVQVEREIVARIIERLNRLSYIQERYHLQLMAYEQATPPIVGDAPQTVVDDYMMKAEQSDVFICIMWARMGTPVTDPQTGEKFQSGTEYEFTHAYRANQKTGKPYILLYQKAQAASQSDPAQMAKVEAFFKRFEGENPDFKGLYRRYTSLAEFEEMLFQHIEQIIARNLINVDKPVESDSLPAIQEETRRVDAAMPGETKVGRPTEVWVQICLPSSEGFRAMLPQYTKTRREEITTRDVRSGGLAVAFPVDKATGAPQPVLVRVELRTADFSLKEPYEEVLLWARTDSGMLTFNLTPTQARERGIVHVVVKQTIPGGTVITLGSASLSTHIYGAGAVYTAAQVAWTLLSLPLAAVELRAGRRQTPASGGEVAGAPSPYDAPYLGYLDDVLTNENDDLGGQPPPAELLAQRPSVDAAIRERVARNEAAAKTHPQVSSPRRGGFPLARFASLILVVAFVGVLVSYLSSGSPAPSTLTAARTTAAQDSTPVAAVPSATSTLLATSPPRRTPTRRPLSPTKTPPFSPVEAVTGILEANDFAAPRVTLSGGTLQISICSTTRANLQGQIFALIYLVARPVAEARSQIEAVNIAIASCGDIHYDLYRASAPIEVITRFVDGGERDASAYRAGWKYIDLF
jgi:hypothetical protein